MQSVATLPTHSSVDEVATPCVTLNAPPSPPCVIAQVASLPWIDFCKLWKDYMVVMAECLVEAAGVVSSPSGQRLAHLVYETGAGWKRLRTRSKLCVGSVLWLARACGWAL